MEWTEEPQKSFASLKGLLTTEPILAQPLFDLEFILQTVAPGHSLGAVLSQVQNGKEVAISYANRHLKAAENIPFKRGISHYFWNQTVKTLFVGQSFYY